MTTQHATEAYYQAKISGLEARVEREDEYHTMDDLYAYRMAYHAHAARGWLLAGVPVVKSWNHSDGALCFGGGWFIVSAQLPAGQVTNHYKGERDE